MNKLSEFRDRVKELVRVPANSLIANDANFRRHPKSQMKALKSGIDEFGFATAVIAYRDDQSRLVVIDGHARAKASGSETIPVLVLDVNEKEALGLLGTLDEICSLATVDQAALDQLISSLNSETVDLLHGLSDSEPSNAESEPDPEPDRSIYLLREDVVFDSDNEFGLPRLRPELISDFIPRATYFEGCKDDALFVFRTMIAPDRSTCANLSLGFFVDDYRFETLWNDHVTSAETIMNQGWRSVCAPDFSLWRSDPMAVQLWNVYRSRWIARYWQELGMRVTPILSWSDDASHRFAHAGIPKGSVVATECRSRGGKKSDEAFVDGIERALEAVNPKAVIVYGGVENEDLMNKIDFGQSELVKLPSWKRKGKHAKD